MLTPAEATSCAVPPIRQSHPCCVLYEISLAATLIKAMSFTLLELSCDWEHTHETAWL